MNLSFYNLDEQLKEGLGELCPKMGVSLSDSGQMVKVNRISCGLSIEREGNEIVVGYNRKSEFFRALGLLKEGKFGQEHPAFETLGLMLDCSRNAVPNLDSLKKMLRIMALMGYNTIMLYTEDTYELPQYPYFGYMRGRYTQEELREIESYAQLFGIEVIPCIQTLAHLNAIKHWSTFNNLFDCDDILLVDEEKTYELIESMIANMSLTLKSRKIHIGMDEAHMVGLGAYLDQHGFHDRFDILFKHQKRVVQICEKYGYKPMIWSDMYLKFLSATSSYYDTSVEVTPEISGKIPKALNLVYWDYYNIAGETYEKMLDNHFKLSPNISFAGGAWKWTGFVPQLHMSFAASKPALDACVNKKVKDVYVTAWGDNGAACQTFSILPVLQLFAEKCYAHDDTDAHLIRRLTTCTGADLNDFLQLDLPNMVPGGVAHQSVVNPSEYLFYQDILCGLFDRHVGAGYSDFYRDSAAKLHGIATKGGEWFYIFENIANLCDVLTLKCDMGVRLKKAYDEKNQNTIGKIAHNELPELTACVREFHKSLRDAWLKENKVFGMDVEDLRIGGLLARIDAAILTLNDYLSGRISKVEELEQKRLYHDCRDEKSGISLAICNNCWNEIVSAGVI